MVHWTMTVDDRAVGWLTPLFHAQFREALLHVGIRGKLLCPAYCLMPDHLHLLWIGVGEEADQCESIRLLRRMTSVMLAPKTWQRQAYDHVLKSEERERGCFQTVVQYILENPERRELAENWEEYPFLGAMVPGAPDVDPRRRDFWDVFWLIYNRQADGAEAAR